MCPNGEWAWINGISAAKWKVWNCKESARFWRQNSADCINMPCHFPPFIFSRDLLDLSPAAQITKLEIDTLTGLRRARPLDARLAGVKVHCKSRNRGCRAKTCSYPKDSIQSDAVFLFFPRITLGLFLRADRSQFFDSPFILQFCFYISGFAVQVFLAVIFWFRPMVWFS